MSVNVGGARIARDIAGIIHSGRRGGEKSGRYRQLLDHRRAARVRNVIFPGDRVEVALASNETVIVDRVGLANRLTAQRAEVDHVAIAPQEPANSRAQRAIADHVAQIVNPVGLAVISRGPCPRSRDPGPVSLFCHRTACM